jgi:hypothetical protein
LESAAESDTAEQLRNHIAELQKSPNIPLERIGYLNERLLGLTAEILPNTDPDVVIIELPDSLIRQTLTKKPAYRQLAGLGILNGVTSVESASAKDLEAELRKHDPASLIKDLPTEAPNNLQTVSNLQLILLDADRVLGKTCRLINYGGQYMSEAATRANPTAIAAQMLSGQVQSQLQQLLAAETETTVGKLNNSNLAPEILPAAAANIANNETADVVEVTSMDLNAAAGSGSVTIATYHRLTKQAKWNRIAVVSSTASSADITHEQRQRILEDAQVKQVAELFRGLGIGNADLGKAVSFGAVVEVAQQRAKSKLSDALQLDNAESAAGLKVLTAKFNELPGTQFDNNDE